jgi:hypothetical protein
VSVTSCAPHDGTHSAPLKVMSTVTAAKPSTQQNTTARCAVLCCATQQGPRNPRGPQAVAGSPAEATESPQPYAEGPSDAEGAADEAAVRDTVLTSVTRVVVRAVVRDVVESVLLGSPQVRAIHIGTASVI